MARWEAATSFAEEVELRDGYVWPKVDRAGAFPIPLKELPGVEVYSKIPPHRRVVVQAGGNCGIFPRAYAHLFETVYTFEPDPLNFYCLVQNAASPNVVKFQAGLGVDRRLLEIVPLFKDNIAGYGVAPGGYIPTMRIDDLAVTACDLIQLDVEGSEFPALLGARETIVRYRPVIVLELKGVGPRLDFGAPANTIRAFLTSLDGWMSRFCDEFGISRKTGYKWLGRYYAEGPAGLQERSSAPLRHGRLLDDAVVSAFLALRERWPHWGARKLRGKLLAAARIYA